MRTIGVSPMACMIESNVLLRCIVHLLHESGDLRSPPFKSLLAEEGDMSALFSVDYRDFPPDDKIGECSPLAPFDRLTAGRERDSSRGEAVIFCRVGTAHHMMR